MTEETLLGGFAMRIEEVEVFITPEGEVKYEVRGVKGKRCLDITQELDRDLGGQIISREETSEMSEVEVVRETTERISTKE
jgi:hypothetical protein